MKNILITGGAGFLGSNLAAKLIQDQNANIIIVDNFITSDFYNIETFVRKPNFEFVKHDLIYPINLEKFDELNKFKIKIYGIEEIYHLACPGSPKNHKLLPLQICLVNSYAVKNTLELARQFKAKFLFASSSAVYGIVPQENQPVVETERGKLENLGPRSCYSNGKRFAENLIVYFGSEFSFPTKIARIFQTYGPKMRINDGRIIPKFIYNCLRGMNIIIYGDKETSRAFCYVDDMIDGLIKLMDSEESGPINLGADHLYKLSDIAQAIIDITESRSKIIYKKPPAYTEPEPVPNISKAKEMLAWLPVTPIENGLIKTVKEMEAGQIHKFNDLKIEKFPNRNSNSNTIV